MKNVWTLYFSFLLATILLASPAAYLISYALSENHTGQALSTLLMQYLQVKRNPLIGALLSLFPFSLLALVVFILQHRKADIRTRYAMMAGGGVAVLLTMLWANLEYWPNFLPDVPYPGFPHGLELVIAPLFFAPVAMLAGAAIGGLLARNIQ